MPRWPAELILMSFVQGRCAALVRAGFKRLPTEHWDACVAILV